MTEAATTYPVPENPEQEAALEKALATRVLQKLDAAKAIFEGENYTGFRAALDALIEMKLPATSATGQNAANLVRFLDTMQQGVSQDRAAAQNVIDPPVVIPVPPVPPVPGAPATV